MDAQISQESRKYLYNFETGTVWLRAGLWNRSNDTILRLSCIAHGGCTGTEVMIHFVAGIVPSRVGWRGYWTGIMIQSWVFNCIAQGGGAGTELMVQFGR